MKGVVAIERCCMLVVLKSAKADGACFTNKGVGYWRIAQLCFASLANGLLVVRVLWRSIEGFLNGAVRRNTHSSSHFDSFCHYCNQEINDRYILRHNRSTKWAKLCNSLILLQINDFGRSLSCTTGGVARSTEMRMLLLLLLLLLLATGWRVTSLHIPSSFWASTWWCYSCCSRLDSTARFTNISPYRRISQSQTLTARFDRQHRSAPPSATR